MWGYWVLMWGFWVWTLALTVVVDVGVLGVRFGFDLGFGFG
jgi:hypothetical protein